MRGVPSLLPNCDRTHGTEIYLLLGFTKLVSRGAKSWILGSLAPQVLLLPHAVCQKATQPQIITIATSIPVPWGF